MNKLFTFLASALVCVASVSAQDVEPVGAEAMQVCTAVPQSFAAEHKSEAMRTPGLRATIEDALGRYTATCEWLGPTGNGKRDINISLVDAATGKVKLTGWPLDYVIEGFIDQSGTVITIPNRQFLGVASNGDSIYLYFKGLAPNGSVLDGVSDVKEIGGYITPTAISFGVNIVWAIGDPNNEKAGWFYLGYNMILEKYIEDWQSIGNATFMDGWILPAFKIDQTDPDNWYQVEMEQDQNHPERYRLVNPYKGESPVASKNTSAVTGYIQFDVTDPEHVVFDIADAGFANSQVGITTLYCYNALTGMSMTLGDAPWQIVASMGSNLPYTTYKDGVLTLGSVDSEVLGHVEDACLGTQADVAACMTWQTASGKLANMSTRIFFPGVTPEIPDPDEGWTSLGEATFMDGWILPVYGIDQKNEENWFKVELQCNDKNHNIYRLVDPYHAKDCPVARYNNSKKRGHIQFDVTDPEHVTLELVPSGMGIDALNMTTIYCSNTLTHQMNYMDLPADQIVDIFGDTFPYTTFKDGVIDMTGFVDDDPTYDILYDACIGSQIDKNSGQHWRSNGVMLDMSTRVIFPENYGNIITTESDENINAPVEYFNLQGVRIADPAAGQVVIRRQGNKVSKIFTR